MIPRVGSLQEWREVRLAFDAWVKKWNVDEEVYRYASLYSYPQDILKAMAKSEQWYQANPEKRSRRNKDKRPVLRLVWSGVL